MRIMSSRKMDEEQKRIQANREKAIPILVDMVIESYRELFDLGKEEEN